MRIGEKIDRAITKRALRRRDLSAETDLEANYDVKNMIKKYSSGNPKNSEETFVFLPGWYEKKWSTFLLRDQITGDGKSYIQYSIAPTLLSSNYNQTLDNFRHIRDEFHEDTRNLEKVTLISASLGTPLGFMIADSSDKVLRHFSICPGISLAHCLLDGIRTQNIRQSFEEQGLDLDKLKELWYDLEPINNLENSGNQTIHIFDSECDTIVPYERSFDLREAIKERGIKLGEHTNKHLGHYGTILNFYLAFHNHLFNHGRVAQ